MYIHSFLWLSRVILAIFSKQYSVSIPETTQFSDFPLEKCILIISFQAGNMESSESSSSVPFNTTIKIWP